jgi:hypothetical protein
MAHCFAAYPFNAFDALVKWAEQGVAPERSW